MPDPIELQEMDQNLYDEEDFLSCQTRGVIPLAGTDWRGVDQGELPVLLWQEVETVKSSFTIAMAMRILPCSFVRIMGL